MVRRRRLYWTTSGKVPMAGSCEAGYEPSACMTTANLLTIWASISVQQYTASRSECTNILILHDSNSCNGWSSFISSRHLLLLQILKPATRQHSISRLFINWITLIRHWKGWQISNASDFHSERDGFKSGWRHRLSYHFSSQARSFIIEMVTLLFATRQYATQQSTDVIN